VIEQLAGTLLRPVLHRALRAKVEGRLIDPARPDLGRLGRTELARVERRLWGHVRELWPRADLGRYPLTGNRLNALLGLVTVAAYRALREEGLSHERAVCLFGDAGWVVYRRMLALPRAVARRLERDPQARMDRILRMLLRFPFNQPPDPDTPGYHATVGPGPDGFRTHWTACPPLEVVRRVGGADELDAFWQTWCQYDYAAAREMVPGGRFERPHALSRGDDVCDMTWSAGELVQIRTPRARPTPVAAAR